MSYRILVINPGSTSTKIAVFKDESAVWEKVIKHSTEDLTQFGQVIEQLDWRQEKIGHALKKGGFKIADFDCIVSRGGAGLDPIPGGTYRVDQEMIADLYQGKNAEHASNLAGIIAFKLAEDYCIPVYTVDPVSVDEFEPLARLSGLPELPRRCQSHALNLKAVARKTAVQLGKKIEDTLLIGVHLGGGISVAALKGGRIVDVNNANQGGPYSPERTGTLPVLDLIDYIYQKKPKFENLKKSIVGRGGLTAYLKTGNGLEIEKRINNGDSEARLVYEGMIYQIAKEIGAMATVLAGKVNGTFITGGLAYSQYIVEGITERIRFIAPVFTFPGAEEMVHLAKGALRILKGEEDARIYRLEKLI